MSSRPTYRPDDDWVAEQRRHGHLATYKAGCSCDQCRAANAASVAATRGRQEARIEHAVTNAEDALGRCTRELALLTCVYSARDAYPLTIALEDLRGALTEVRRQSIARARPLTERTVITFPTPGAPTR